MPVYTMYKVQVDRKKFIDRSDWVKYLTLNRYQLELMKKVNPEILETVPSKKFTKFVEKQVQNYMDGKKPAKPIASAVMNCADMYMNGKEITLLAGDYISLQNQFRATE